MPAFFNLDFETAGASAGYAAGWVWTRSTATVWAGYPRADGGLGQAEGFEFGWGVDTPLFVLEAPHINRATYAPNAAFFEAFEKGWNNDFFLFVWDTAIAALYNAGTPLMYEPFEVEWGNDGYRFTFTGGTAALYNVGSPIAHEGFEAEWVDGGYLTTLSIGHQDAALFRSSGSLVAFEDFESFVMDQAFTVDLPSTINAIAHGFANGDKVRFFTAIDDPNASQLPAGLADRVLYFVKNSTTDTFQLSATSGGSTIVMTTVQAGAVYVRTDTDEHWGGFEGDTMGADP